MTAHPRTRPGIPGRLLATPRPGPRPRGGRRLLPPFAPRTTALVLVVLAVTGALLWSGPTREAAPGSPPRDRVEALLDRVGVVDERVTAPGYDRDCTGASACVFGPAWSDTTGAPGSGNGCPTRHDVLARDLHGAVIDPGRPCRVTGGVLVDPYTGRAVDVGRAGTGAVHVDHVFPLSAAWDLGASTWSARRRAAFANDMDRNLLAVAGSVNTRKSDSTPSDWLPPEESRHCFYAARYLTAAVAYRLPVTGSDHDALTAAVRRCPPGG